VKTFSKDSHSLTLHVGNHLPRLKSRVAAFSNMQLGVGLACSLLLSMPKSFYPRSPSSLLTPILVLHCLGIYNGIHSFKAISCHPKAHGAWRLKHLSQPSLTILNVLVGMEFSLEARLALLDFSYGHSVWMRSLRMDVGQAV
jgi:hypothetical protein